MPIEQAALDLPGLEIQDFSLSLSGVIIRLRSEVPAADCPSCGCSSSRVHSHYTRTVADLACLGRPVLLQLLLRRFRCPNPDCPRGLFCERLPGFLKPHARTTDRLTLAHFWVGLALGGEPGSRLAGRLAIPTSADTLLRRVKVVEADPTPPPIAIGIDDRAWYKGRSYGTIIVDLLRGGVIDLLPDREAATVERWLRDHPQIEVISRDRGAVYIKAATEGAPQAKQVADRWHLLKNLREAVEALFDRHHGAIEGALQRGSAGPGGDDEPDPRAADVVAAPDVELVPPEPEATTRERAPTVKQQRREERFQAVLELHRRGTSVRCIARTLGLSRNAVRRYLRCSRCPDWDAGQPRPRGLDRWRDWIIGRIEGGCANTAELYRELGRAGWKGSVATVRRFFRERLEVADRGSAVGPEAAATPPPIPSPRRLSFLFVQCPEERSGEDEARLETIGSYTRPVRLSDRFGG